MNDAEPEPAGDVVKPAFVKGKAAKLWDQYAPQLEAQGVLTSWDVDMFGAWCCLMAEFQKKPALFTPSKISQMRALASSFGLDPSARSRLKTGGKKETKQNPVAKYLG